MSYQYSIRVPGKQTFGQTFDDTQKELRKKRHKNEKSKVLKICALIAGISRMISEKCDKNRSVKIRAVVWNDQIISGIGYRLHPVK